MVNSSIHEIFAEQIIHRKSLTNFSFAALFWIASPRFRLEMLLQVHHMVLMKKITNWL